jgi:hypothetical protein
MNILTENRYLSMVLGARSPRRRVFCCIFANTQSLRSAGPQSALKSSHQ